ncbi:MAG: biopolymer transporter ExbD [Oleiphilaceae bacterium]|nr:biopolymer transporter ExbD [Oleiphilaceae bacterium]
MTLPSFLPPHTRPDEGLTDRLEDGLLPLINVVFLLLMFFLILGLIMQDSVPPLPQTAASATERNPRLDLVIAADGSLQHKGEPIRADQLGDRLPEYDENRRLRVGAHQDLAMSDLEARFRDLSQAGHPEVILLTDIEP